MDCSGSVMLGGSGAIGLGREARVMPAQPTSVSILFPSSEAWYWSWFIIEWKPRIAAGGTLTVSELIPSDPNISKRYLR